MKHTIFLIDAQNDFCDTPTEKLPVVNSEGRRAQPQLAVKGAYQDMQRTAQFITQASASNQIGSIVATLDSHAKWGIERPSFWFSVDADGQKGPVFPFTPIKAQDVIEGRFVPRSTELTQKVVGILTALEAKGADPLMVWTEHCVVASWGHNLVDSVRSAISGWEELSGRVAQVLMKGTNPLTEHYGIFEAEVPLPEDPQTQFNTKLADQLIASEGYIFVGGEASSHCVSGSVMQFIGYVQKQPDAVAKNVLERLVILSDCMSPVTGFEHKHAAFMEKLADLEIKVMSHTEALALLKGTFVPRRRMM